MGILMDWRKHMEKVIQNMTTPEGIDVSESGSSTQKHVAPVTNKLSEMDKQVKS